MPIIFIIVNTDILIVTFVILLVVVIIISINTVVTIGMSKIPIIAINVIIIVIIIIAYLLARSVICVYPTSKCTHMWVTCKIFARILYRPFKPIFIVISILYSSFILFDHKLSAVYND